MRIKKTSDTAPVIGQVVNSNSDSTTDTYSCDYANKAFGGKVLWTNSSPTSSLASDIEINLSSSDYAEIECIYATDTTDNYYLSTGKIPKGKSFLLMTVAGVSGGALTRNRYLNYISDTKYKTTAANQAIGATAASAVNTNLIPIKIIGYKTGIFN